MEEAAKAFGIINPEPVETKPALYEVWPENMPVVDFFMKHCQTAWRSSMGGLTGLDDGNFEWLFRLEKVEDPLQMLAGLRTMERAILKQFANTEEN